jgi:acetyl esterase/lipase
MTQVDAGAWLDPEVAAAAGGFPPGIRSDRWLDQARTARVLSTAGHVPSPGVELTERVVDEASGVSVRVHRPTSGAGLPAVYAIHGGGYVLGTATMEDPRLDRWAAALGCVGVAVDYRLAPEHPYPTPLEDCYAGLVWLHEHAGELGVDPARIGISGRSAGGGLAAGLALLARDRGGPAIAFQLLGCPMLDDRMATVSSGWTVPVWDPRSNAYGWRSYLGAPPGTDDVPAYAAPARAGDLTGLPPALVSVGTVDGFLHEDVAYASRLLEAGVPTELHVYPGGCHGFENFAPEATISRRAVRDTEEWLAARLGAI